MEMAIGLHCRVHGEGTTKD